MFKQISNFIPPRFGRTQKIHFIGIGGAGMCGIAEVLHNLGYCVSGSDQVESQNTKHLHALHISVFIGHQKKHIKDADVVVVSTVIPEHNPEVIAARENNIPVIRRAEMLAELMRLQHGIAIAGTHGKTTTTSLVTSLLSEEGLDPTYVIGGKLNSSGLNARLGKSAYFVAETDESDASFLLLHPTVAVVTNIDEDHMETYDGDFKKLKEAFLKFIHHLPFYGLAILCLDDPTISKMLPDISRKFLTYGFNSKSHYHALDFKQEGTRCFFKCIRPAPYPPLNIILNMLGRHNVLNAMAAIAVATEHGVSDEAILCALNKFAGVSRRIQQHGTFKCSKGEILLLEDYGHHPKEIEVTIDAIRGAWPDRRLVSIFQPHRYTRTQTLFKDFVKVLSKVDLLLLMDIYPAGEDKILNVSSQHLCDAVRSQKKMAFTLSEDLLSFPALLDFLEDKDVLLLQGAGDIGHYCTKLAIYFKESQIENLEHGTL